MGERLKEREREAERERERDKRDRHSHIRIPTDRPDRPIDSHADFVSYLILTSLL